MTSIVKQNYTPDDIIKLSEIFSKSAMVPKDYQGKPNNCFVAIEWGREIGLAPLQALQNIAVINGKPSVYGDELLAMVRADDRCRGVTERITGKGDDRVAICEILRAHVDGSIEKVTRQFSVNDAKQARLWGKAGPWQQYSERMLQHRARGNCIRDAFPDVIKGLITYEEAQDIPINSVKAVQAPTITSGTNTPEDIAKAVTDASKASQTYSIRLPNKQNVETFNTPQDFVERYNNLLGTVRHHKDLSSDEKRTKMKELEEINIESVGQFESLLEKRLAYNKALSYDEPLREREKTNGK